MSTQEGFSEPTNCPECKNENIEKRMTAPASIRMDGKTALRSLPDPTPPLRALQEKGPREGCEGGYKDLPEMGKLERRKTKDGQWEWTEKKKQVYDMGKK